MGPLPGLEPEPEPGTRRVLVLELGTEPEPGPEIRRVSGLGPELGSASGMQRPPQPRRRRTRRHIRSALTLPRPAGPRVSEPEAERFSPASLGSGCCSIASSPGARCKQSSQRRDAATAFKRPWLKTASTTLSYRTSRWRSCFGTHHRCRGRHGYRGGGWSRRRSVFRQHLLALVAVVLRVVYHGRRGRSRRGSRRSCPRRGRDSHRRSGGLKAEFFRGSVPWLALHRGRGCHWGRRGDSHRRSTGLESEFLRRRVPWLALNGSRSRCSGGGGGKRRRAGRRSFDAVLRNRSCDGVEPHRDRPFVVQVA